MSLAPLARSPDIAREQNEAAADSAKSRPFLKEGKRDALEPGEDLWPWPEEKRAMS
jgi:hypothetical protein